MRPLHLRFAGINSYSGLSEIDFELLQKEKIFGVFGETGAGKSTIIDAITFALFGRIDRVGAEIKTSINPLSKKMEADLLFRIGRKTYRVVRTLSERKSEAHLYDVGEGGAVPMADKAREVNDAVSRLIGGFEYQEFTKVIALPQNKFSEFLGAEPAKRALLLEKIFDLAKYGEELGTRLGDEEAKAEGDAKALRAALEQLSDISPERLLVKREEKERAAGEIAGIQKDLETTEKAVRELEELERLLRDRAQALKERENLLARSARMEEARLTLKSARAVAPLGQDVRNGDDWIGDLERLSRELADLRSQQAGAEEALAAALGEREGFEKSRAERLPAMALERKSAEEAMELAATLGGLRERHEALRSAAKRAAEQAAAADRALRDGLGERATLEKARKALKGRLDGLQLTDKETAFYESTPAVEGLAGELREAEGSMSKEKKGLARFVSETERTKREALALWSTELPDIPCDDAVKAEEVLALHLKAAEAEVRSLQEELHREELRNQSSILAQGLAEGEACPVCGSPHHPAPAAPADEKRFRRLRADLGSRTEFLARLKGVEGRLKPLARTIEKAVAATLEAERRIDEITRGVDARRQSVVEATGLTIEEAREKRAALDERLAGMKRATKELSALQEKEARRGKAVEALQTKLHSLQIEGTQLAGQVDAVAALLGETEKRIRGLVGDDPPDGRLRRLDAEGRTLKQQAAGLAKKVDAAEAGLRALKERIAQGEGRRSETEKKLRAVQERLEEAVGRLGMTNEELRAALRNDNEMKDLQQALETYDHSLKEMDGRLKEIEKRLGGLTRQEMEEGALTEGRAAVKALKEKASSLAMAMGGLEAEIWRISEGLEKKASLEAQRAGKEDRLKTIGLLKDVLRGRDFVQFIVKQLGGNIIRLASQSFYALTGGRMSLRLSDDKFSFFVEDHMTGERRPISTLSGGETFLASFALALALSRHIQTMKARPIHFFFIDEGFGTLDDETLVAVTGVMDALRSEDVLVGFITHRKEMRDLVSNQLIVSKSPAGGSAIRMRA